MNNQELVDLYLSMLPELSIETYSTRQYVLREFIEAFKDKSILELTAVDIRNYVIKKKENGDWNKISIISINLSIIKMFYNFLITEKYLSDSENPTQNIKSPNSQTSIHKQRYLTLKREMLQAQALAQSELQVKEEDKEKVAIALAMLARTIYRLREKRKLLKRAYILSKKLRELEKDLRKSIAQLSYSSSQLSQKSNAENTLNQNLIRQNQHEYFIHKLQFAIALLEDKKERLEIQLLKFNIKLDRAEKY